MNILKVTNLSKVYSSEKSEVAALDGLSLRIEKGDYTVLMGPSGAGKSTLLNILSGLDSPTDGSVLMLDREITSMNESELSLFRRKEIGFIFQSFNLVPNLTVLENILISGYLQAAHRTERKSVKEKAMVLLKDMGIAELADRMPSEISGGEMQRAAIARALINSPTVIMADEPTGNLNSSSTGQVLDIFSKLHINKQTIVTVTHELKAACRGNRIFYINDGRIEGIFQFNNDIGQLEKREAELFSWLSERGW